MTTKMMILILALMAMLTFYLSRPIYTSSIIYVPSGSYSYIIKTFINKGYSLNNFDKYILYVLGTPQHGFIDLGANSFSKIQFLYSLVKSKGAVYDFIAIPGESTYFFLKQISDTLGLDSNKMQSIYKQKALYFDGIILSDTYRLNMNMNEKEIVDFLVISSMKKHIKLAKKYLGKYEKEIWFKYIIIASIIQKEASDVNEMPIISSVIYNRIKKRMYLQMDGSLNYGKYAHTKVTKKRIKTDISFFNTYKYKKIPPSPVSMVSIDAIKSAIFPIKSDYLYFVINKKTKKHIFTRTYKKHNQYVKKL